MLDDNMDGKSFPVFDGNNLQNIFGQQPASNASAARTPVTNGPQSPPTYYGTTVKTEPMDDSKHDSGVSDSSPWISPASDRSENSQPGPDRSYMASNPFMDQARQRYENGSPNGYHSSSSRTPSPKTQTSSDLQETPSKSVPSSPTKKQKPTICRNCRMSFASKEELWRHVVVHMRPDKILRCNRPNCPFVTELKHHLEFHMLNHDKIKPYKCFECDYKCVNKSMLNSHLKSHSDVFQYTCDNCNYISKYMHSLKMHLRKFQHTPGVVYNSDGSINTSIIIDVYGTRRGPKAKKVIISPKSSSTSTPPKPPAAPSTITKPPVLSPVLEVPQPQLMNPFLNAAAMMNLPMLPLPLMPQEMMMNFTQLLKDRISNFNLNQRPLGFNYPLQKDDNSVLDLSNKNSSDVDDEEMRTAFDNVEAVVNAPNDEVIEIKQEAEEEKTPQKDTEHLCQYCEITFGDQVLYSIHMGYHGFNSPFTCNMCGEKCGDKVNFFLHIAKTAH